MAELPSKPCLAMPVVEEKSQFEIGSHRWCHMNDGRRHGLTFTKTDQRFIFVVSDL